MNAEALFWVLACGFSLTCFVAIGARSLRQFSRHELEEICRRKGNRERLGEILRHHTRVAQATESFVLLATALLVVTGTYFLFFYFKTPTDQLSWDTLLLGTLFWGVALSLAKLWIPWAVANLWSEPILYHTWPIWKVIGWGMTPLLSVAKLFDTVFHRLAGRQRQELSEETFEEEIRTIVTEGHRGGYLEEDAREMIEGVMDLADAAVSEIMTPRTEINMIHVGLSWEEMLQTVIKMGHTRIPVYDTNRDDIIGVLYSKDLLPELARPADQEKKPIRKVTRKAHFVPETKKVDDLLAEFQQTRNHLAIVLDEYGGVSGLVTIEDVLEEIVGEIIDEYDEELEEEIKHIDPTTWEVLGKMHIDELNAIAGIDLPDEGDYDTVAGFVFSELGRIPHQDESLVWEDQVKLTVLEVSRRRIERLRIELKGQQSHEVA